MPHDFILISEVVSNMKISLIKFMVFLKLITRNYRAFAVKLGTDKRGQLYIN